MERKAELTAAGRRKVQAVAAHSAFVTLTVDGLYEYVERCSRPRSRIYATAITWSVDGEVVIVDEFTGRLMPGRQWQDGLHQAIQAKEKLEITLETITAARVTVQDFFKRYHKLAGMTGTALTDAAELRRIYKVGVFQRPHESPRTAELAARPRLLDRGRKVPRGGRPDCGMEQDRGAGAGRHPVDREVREAEHAAGRRGHRAPDPERQEPRDRGPDRGAGGPEGSRDGRHQHGRPRDGHQAGRRRGGGWRPARHRDRAARVAANRPPARGALRTAGRPGTGAVLHLPRGRDRRGVRREAGGPATAAVSRQRRADERLLATGDAQLRSTRKSGSISAIASCSCTTRNSGPRCGGTWGSIRCWAETASCRIHLRRLRTCFA